MKALNSGVGINAKMGSTTQCSLFYHKLAKQKIIQSKTDGDEDAIGANCQT